MAPLQSFEVEGIPIQNDSCSLKTLKFRRKRQKNERIIAKYRIGHVRIGTITLTSGLMAHTYTLWLRLCPSPWAWSEPSKPSVAVMVP